MLFTWNTQDLCIVFRQWHVSGTPSLIWSLMAIIALTAGYEAIREISRRYEAHSNVRRADDIPSESEPFLAVSLLYRVGTIKTAHKAYNLSLCSRSEINAERETIRYGG